MVSSRAFTKVNPVGSACQWLPSEFAHTGAPVQNAAGANAFTLVQPFNKSRVRLAQAYAVPNVPFAPNSLGWGAHPTQTTRS